VEQTNKPNKAALVPWISRNDNPKMVARRFRATHVWLGYCVPLWNFATNVQSLGIGGRRFVVGAFCSGSCPGPVRNTARRPSCFHSVASSLGTEFSVKTKHCPLSLSRSSVWDLVLDLDLGMCVCGMNSPPDISAVEGANS